MNVCICIFLELLAATNVSGIVVTLVTIKYSIEARLIRSLYNPVYLSRAYKFVTCECKGCLPHCDTLLRFTLGKGSSTESCRSVIDLSPLVRT